MEIREVTEEKCREEWDKVAPHPLQTWEWGEFRKKTGVKVARWGIFHKDKLVQTVQITIHPIPYTSLNVGYYPKGSEITKDTVAVLTKLAKQYNCIYIKCEPKVEENRTENVEYGIWMTKNGFAEGRALFTKYNFVLDVTPNEETLLKNMKQKTRYNIRLARKRGVKVSIDNSSEAFKRYLELTKETTERQGFYAHSPEYHTTMWETVGGNANTQTSGQADKRTSKNALKANLMVAKYEGEIITTWVLFSHNDTLYYPYGASSRDHREVMANNLVMWEAIRMAKSRGMKYLDMWGALGTNPDKNDPWYGFHKFKEGYGARHVEYVGTWDYVAKPVLYYPYKIAEWARWKVLRLLKK